MNRRVIAVAILALALAPAMQTLRAEEHEQGKKHEWKEKLGLSDDQVKKLEDLRASEKAEMKPLRDKGHALVEKLEGQIKSKASDADIKATLDELAANHNSMEQIEDKSKESRSSILTPTQQAKMLVSRMKHHKKMEEAEKGKEKGEKEDEDE